MRYNPIVRQPAMVALAAVATLCLSVSAQQGQDGFLFRSGVDLVSVTATVTDKEGRFVPGLTLDDFTVHDDDRRVEIAHFSAERVPVSLGIVLDTSGSMQGEKIETALAAIERFLSQLLSPEDEVFVCGFSRDVELIQGWTKDLQAVSDSLRRVRPFGGTAMYDAVVAAAPMAQAGRNAKKAIVLISDGNDTDSQTSSRNLRKVVRQSEVLVYAIGIDGRVERTRSRTTWPGPSPYSQFPQWGISDDRLNVGALREITDDSGGRTEIVRNASDLNAATTSIADELSRQYYLGYPSPGHRDGRWHAIKVKVRDQGQGLRVRARRGYLATS